jgi:hypothetical protein
MEMDLYAVRRSQKPELCIIPKKPRVAVKKSIGQDLLMENIWSQKNFPIK